VNVITCTYTLMYIPRLYINVVYNSDTVFIVRANMSVFGQCSCLFSMSLMSHASAVSTVSVLLGDTSMKMFGRSGGSDLMMTSPRCS